MDFCMSLGSVSYLCLQGVGKPERAAKVDRWQEILEHLHALTPLSKVGNSVQSTPRSTE